ncbi:unnamed protein product [Euphydryas editha]|uniref:PiggyBac transposable element-derived protein 4 C-terminal zinc-ribbon domain-containing protein n=1 Tax=Euphydryas editha TaxID=104508 RepID=A0AAU9UXR5_EUPED|nr:unnamed protein product [Euphydryas editha]
MAARLITDDDIVRALEDDDYVNTNDVFSDSENEDTLGLNHEERAEVQVQILEQSDPGSPLIPENASTRKRKSCSLCSYKKRRKTKNHCNSCRVPICGQHTVNFYPTCAKKSK